MTEVDRALSSPVIEVEDRATPTHPWLSSPAVDQRRKHPEVVLAEVAGLLERPAEVPGP